MISSRDMRLLRSVLIAMLAFIASDLQAQSRITTPVEQFGHAIGDDYFLANYTQLVDYWKKLDQESDRMSMVEIGRTAEGRPMYVAILTSPDNQIRLARYREIAQ